MSSFTLSFRSSHPIVFLFLFCSFLSRAHACFRMTGESCSQDGHCFGNRFCISNRTDEFGFKEACRPVRDNDCTCTAPWLSHKSCTSDSDCPTFETCVTSKINQNSHTSTTTTTNSTTSICIGCDALKKNPQYYIPVSTTISKTSCPSKDIRPACGRTLNYCNSTLPCTAFHICVDMSTSTYSTKLPFSTTSSFQCSSSSSPCQCIPRSLSLKQCITSTDCGVRETCAKNLFTGFSLCVSCDTIHQHPQFITIDQNDNDKCQKIKNRPLPVYAPGPNGKNYDYCQQDLTCTDGRKCRQYKKDNDPTKGTKKCTGPDKLCFCLRKKDQSLSKKQRRKQRKCKSEQDCDMGEECAKVLRITNNKPRCVSKSLKYSIPSAAYTLIKSSTNQNKIYDNQDGNGVTGDTCKFDWDCKSPRRCTHHTDEYGGCAGRKYCTCEPLSHRKCTKDSDCEQPGEQCATIIGTNIQPYCVSTKAIDKDPLLNFPNVQITTVTNENKNSSGLNMAPCNSDSNCQSGRSCVHVATADLPCSGHAYCVCKKKNTNNLNVSRKECTKNGDCDPGEVCADIVDAFPKIGKCIAEQVVSENEMYEQI